MILTGRVTGSQRLPHVGQLFFSELIRSRRLYRKPTATSRRSVVPILTETGYRWNRRKSVRIHAIRHDANSGQWRFVPLQTTVNTGDFDDSFDNSDCIASLNEGGGNDRILLNSPHDRCKINSGDGVDHFLLRDRMEGGRIDAGPGNDRLDTGPRRLRCRTICGM